MLFKPQLVLASLSGKELSFFGPTILTVCEVHNDNDWGPEWAPGRSRRSLFIHPEKEGEINGGGG